jgi:3'(2'), 5'-bisphosphate nucleotidase
VGTGGGVIHRCRIACQYKGTLVAADDTEIAALFTALAVRAAAAILQFDCRKVASRQKADRSMVTAADEAAEAAILPGLAALHGIPVVSEESTREAHAGDYVLVDPLDGTAEFLGGRDEYTVNIALVRGGVPAIGVIAAPALGLVWRGAAGTAERLRVSDTGEIVERIAIRTRAWPAQRVATISRSHYEPASAEFLQRFAPVTTLVCGSALKFCRLAEGMADIYPRLAPTSEWDVAAGHALVVAAGGAMAAPDGRALMYGRGEDHRVPGFVAWGDPAAATRPARS